MVKRILGQLQTFAITFSFRFSIHGYSDADTSILSAREVISPHCPAAFFAIWRCQAASAWSSRAASS